MTNYRAIDWKGDHLVLLDQRQLPQKTVYVTLRTADSIAEVIRNMTVRGAPAIGAAAGYGLALEAIREWSSPKEMLTGLEQAGQRLTNARPTAVNLAWAVQRVLEAGKRTGVETIDQIRQAVVGAAEAIAAEEVANNMRIGLNALPLWPEKVTFLHHCNTGALATVDYGTALGVIRAAHESGREVFVFVDETRPRLQGARLTAWELEQMGIPYQVIVDGAAAHVLKTRGVTAVTVGCDRIAANGDTANKIGTYMLALAARAHNVPFYVVGPTSTIDLATPNGGAIPIEERESAEVTRINGKWITPDGASAYNPAFDVTPAEYITGIITEQGIATAPYEQSLREMVAQAQKARAAAAS